jgi:nucleoside-diphosphate-sugar epimerase
MTENLKIIVVFGGAGFIGHHLLKRLKQTQEERLISVDLQKPKYPVEGVEYRIGDVRDLSKFEVNGPISRIYNLAAIHTTPGHPFYAYYDTNVGGATEVTAFARRHNINEIVFTSSISVYGPGGESKDETAKLSPESAYGWSKYLAEGIFRSWLEENETRRLIIGRPAVVFGLHEGGNFTRMAKLLKKGFFVYPGRKDTIKACFYVEDLLEAFDHALSTGARYVLFNGCYPDRYTIEQIVAAFRSAHFKKVKEFTIPYFLVKLAAIALRPFSFLGLGIHPDRVNKLVRSTDICPGWLMAQNFAKTKGLPNALQRWAQASQESFE